MRFTRLLLLLAVFGALVPASGFAQIENPQAIFNELTRLNGTWFMPTDRGDRLEIWQIADDSTLTGRGCRIKPENGDTVLLETLRLELRGGEITYSALVRGQNQGKSIPFKLTDASNVDEYIFENPAHDDPKKIRYFLLERRELQVTTEGVRNGRPTKQEFVFEREFNPASVELRLRMGLNVNTLYQTNEVGISPAPAFSPRPGWELGTGLAFRGSGGFISLNVEAGLSGRSAHVKSEFASSDPDTINGGLLTYRRDLTYNQLWFTFGLLPEVQLRRGGKFSLVFGPYFSRMLVNKVVGTEEPFREKTLPVDPSDPNSKQVANPNTDFKKTDLGGVFGFQWRHNFGKRDLDGQLGFRAQIGLRNMDNLYNRDIVQTTTLYNGRISFAGAALTYSVNLMKL